jgi:hypothetical protein
MPTGHGRRSRLPLDACFCENARSPLSRTTIRAHNAALAVVTVTGARSSVHGRDQPLGAVKVKVPANWIKSRYTVSRSGQ